jgi:hypothetical protein
LEWPTMEAYWNEPVKTLNFGLVVLVLRAVMK